MRQLFRSFISNDKSRIQERTEKNRIKRFNPVIRRVLSADAKHIPQPRKILLDKTNRTRDTGRLLVETDKNEKECNYEIITTGELLISKFMNAITDKKHRDKLLNEKTWVDQNDRSDQTEHIREENNKNTIPEVLNSNQENEIKEKPIQRMDIFNTRPRNKFDNNRPCIFYNAPNWNPTQTCPAIDQTCSKCGKTGHFARACGEKEKFAQKVTNQSRVYTALN